MRRKDVPMGIVNEDGKVLPRGDNVKKAKLRIESKNSAKAAIVEDEPKVEVKPAVSEQMDQIVQKTDEPSSASITLINPGIAKVIDGEVYRTHNKFGREYKCICSERCRARMAEARKRR